MYHKSQSTYSQAISIEQTLNENGELYTVKDVLLFYGYIFIKPFVSVMEGFTSKAVLSLFGVLLFVSEPSEVQFITGSMFYVPMDLVALLLILWCSDIVTGIIRATLINKQPFIPVKVMMWFVRGLVYIVGLGLVSAFLNTGAKYFGDLFIDAQAFVFLVVAFTELWSNLRNLFGPDMKNAPIGRAIIALLSGRGLRAALQEIMIDDNSPKHPQS
jgi:hypothetical protein